MSTLSLWEHLELWTLTGLSTPERAIQPPPDVSPCIVSPSRLTYCRLPFTINIFTHVPGPDAYRFALTFKRMRPSPTTPRTAGRSLSITPQARPRSRMTICEIPLSKHVTAATTATSTTSGGSAEGDSRGSGGRIVRQVLSGPERTKLDVSDDRVFYDFPRFVKHVDDSFLDQVTELYRQRIPPGGAVLDLCSSWVSHLPPEISYSKVVGHGLNAKELARNPRFDTFWVRDLNREPDGWAAADRSFDAVVCCVSVQYLTQPERVFSEIYRVLKPGGVAIFTFSNRMFFSKAIQAWRDTSEVGRCRLVAQYFQAVEGFTSPEVLREVTPRPQQGEGAVRGALGSSNLGAGLTSLLAPLGRLWQRSGGDPFYAVVAYRNFKPE